MMIKIEAIVREEVFEDVKEALNKIEVNGITVSQVMGCGAAWLQKRVRGTEVDVMMLPKIKFEIVVSSEEWGKRRPLRPFRRLLLQGRSAMARFSVTRFARP